MELDIGNALAAVADPGVTESALQELDERVGAAHGTIERGRSEGAFGYRALDLPAAVDTDAIHEAVDGFDPAAVLTVGIGGSALGARTITAALGPARPEHRILDNVDPAQVNAVLETLPLAETLVHVVSRSGRTAETLANFLVVRDAMETAGVDWTDRTVFTTGDEGPLRELADQQGIPALSTPEGVPGRFSALSAVGLVPAAVRGHDIEALLAGARGVTLSDSLFDCPAYAYGALAYAFDQRGADVQVMMPYAEQLEPFAEWYAQLFAESLGKDGTGPTPVRALGATDQHSQLQLYRAGPANKFVTLLRPRERPAVPVPEPDDEEFSYLGGHGLGTLLDAEFEATEASLAESGRPNVRMEFERIDAHRLGQLLYEMEAACILAGELYGVETFTQPAVEWGKRAARGLLGEEEFEETETVAEKHRLQIE